MKRPFFSFLKVLLLLVCVSCGKIVNKPEILIPEKEMASLVADLAINDQMMLVDPKISPSQQAEYIFNQKKIKIKDFRASYQYYLATEKISGIFDEAMQIIDKKDPKLKTYIQNKNKGESPEKSSQ